MRIQLAFFPARSPWFTLWRVVNVFGQRDATTPDEDHPIEAFVFDRPSLTIRVDGITLAYGIQLDLATMALTIAKASDTEKITINLGLIDLGQIDLLVQEGFYSNRTDFIRTAIRNHLGTHAEVVRQTVSRKTLVLGLQEFSRADLEAVKKSGKRLRIQVLGLARIAPDVSATLALAAIESVSVLGAFHASPAVKAALVDRIH